MKECDLLKFDKFMLIDILYSTKYMTFAARGGESVLYSEKIKEYTETRLMTLLWGHYYPAKQKKHYYQAQQQTKTLLPSKTKINITTRQSKNKKQNPAK